MPPDLALTLISSNYPCLEHFHMDRKVFEPLKFYCTCIWHKYLYVMQLTLNSSNPYISKYSHTKEYCLHLHTFSAFVNFYSCYLKLLVSRSKLFRIADSSVPLSHSGNVVSRVGRIRRITTTTRCIYYFIIFTCISNYCL